MTTRNHVNIPSADWVELTEANASTFTIQNQGLSIWIRGTSGVAPLVTDTGGIELPHLGTIENGYLDEWFQGDGANRVFARGISGIGKAYFSYE